jgi:hypothetical protein
MLKRHLSGIGLEEFRTQISTISPSEFTHDAGSKTNSSTAYRRINMQYLYLVSARSFLRVNDFSCKHGLSRYLCKMHEVLLN